MGNRKWLKEPAWLTALAVLAVYSIAQTNMGGAILMNRSRLREPVAPKWSAQPAGKAEKQLHCLTDTRTAMTAGANLSPSLVKSIVLFSNRYYTEIYLSYSVTWTRSCFVSIGDYCDTRPYRGQCRLPGLAVDEQGKGLPYQPKADLRDTGPHGPSWLANLTVETKESGKPSFQFNTRARTEQKLARIHGEKGTKSESKFHLSREIHNGVPMENEFSALKRTIDVAKTGKKNDPNIKNCVNKNYKVLLFNSEQRR